MLTPFSAPKGCLYLQRLPRRHTFLRKSRQMSSSLLPFTSVCLTSSLPESLLSDMFRRVWQPGGRSLFVVQCPTLYTQDTLNAVNARQHKADKVRTAWSRWALAFKLLHLSACQLVENVKGITGTWGRQETAYDLLPVDVMPQIQIFFRDGSSSINRSLTLTSATKQSLAC